MRKIYLLITMLATLIVASCSNAPNSSLESEPELTFSDLEQEYGVTFEKVEEPVDSSQILTLAEAKILLEAFKQAEEKDLKLDIRAEDALSRSTTVRYNGSRVYMDEDDGYIEHYNNTPSLDISIDFIFPNIEAYRINIYLFVKYENDRLRGSYQIMEHKSIENKQSAWIYTWGKFSCLMVRGKDLVKANMYLNIKAFANIFGSYGDSNIRLTQGGKDWSNSNPY